MSAPGKKKSVLFFCLGNICRSTMAEGIMRHLVQQKGEAEQWLIDSAGIGDWFIGSAPHEYTMKILKKNGIVGYKHTGRQIKREDFNTFDYIFGMDHDNLSDVESFKPKSPFSAKLKLLGEYDPEKQLVIVDPYFAGTIDGFEQVYEQCYRCCKNFLESYDK
ncbi:low molecular weight phosphotyrosine protein phosphatase-like [Gigantopelta aegis]|uniref:low molecular weight phosphotyrosine protein phosphatase-like n=1 Tax=Gigantopelta aegis TaxID=1735272 RepID=UPI001B88BEBE|nr:low molecular weight phosphotyrosine protein phosphatase-like [Gigantopelta aegis]